MNAILGFNAFHADSAACLVVEGQLVGAVAEERLGDRQKHSPAAAFINAVASTATPTVRSRGFISWISLFPPTGYAPLSIICN